MMISEILFSLTIQPLVLLFEFVFAMAYRVIDEPGTCIVVLSLAMNLLVLPLYRRADEMQSAEQQREAALSEWAGRIRKTFRGDERYMMMQAYYRENHYKPIYAIRGSLPLLLEVPFFIAAYRYLSGLELLKGCDYGPIANLGAPDGLIRVGGVILHLLPILMTLINILSGAVYTKGMERKAKLQLYGMALVFLVLLYPSPSGLVFYWTLNNVFSLAKNIFYKLKNPRRALGVICCAAGLLIVAAAAMYPQETLKKQIVVLFAGGVLVLAPAVRHLLAARGAESKEKTGGGRAETILFWLGMLCLTILTGLLIPSALIGSSPTEFVNISAYVNPLRWMLNALLVAAGTFLLWPGVFYALVGAQSKKKMACAAWVLAVVFALNYMFFGVNRGVISNQLIYDTYPEVTRQAGMVNLLTLLAVAGACWVLWRKRKSAARIVCLAMCAGMLAMSIGNAFAIQASMGGLKKNIAIAEKSEPRIVLSKTGKNVVVLMMDRAIGSYVRYLFNEKPELEKQFAGFTWYPNTLSFGARTISGVPSLLGGYEYTPEEMNKRNTMLMKDKHNEALLVVPDLFYHHGWDVTVCDPPYVNYESSLDLSLYDRYPGMKAFITDGRYNPELKQTIEEVEHIWKRNLFCYSLYQCAPLLMGETLYANGLYNELDALERQRHMDENYRENYPKQYPHDGPSVAVGFDKGFVDAYWVMHSLPEITELVEEEKGVYLFLENDMTHDDMLLAEPEYEFSWQVDNREYDETHQERFQAGGEMLHWQNATQMQHYHVNMAAFLQIGRWLDWMREKGVYDNTRIIIVADHGRGLAQLDRLLLPEDPDGMGDIMWVNPLLMVKDFDSREFRVDEAFMTNADVPLLSMEGLIEHPVNPFTGKEFTDAAKDGGKFHVYFSNEHSPEAHKQRTEYVPGLWYEFEEGPLSAERCRRMN